MLSTFQVLFECFTPSFVWCAQSSISSRRHPSHCSLGVLLIWQMKIMTVKAHTTFCHNDLQPSGAASQDFFIGNLIMKCGTKYSVQAITGKTGWACVLSLQWFSIFHWVLILSHCQWLVQTKLAIITGTLFILWQFCTLHLCQNCHHEHSDVKVGELLHLFDWSDFDLHTPRKAAIFMIFTLSPLIFSLTLQSSDSSLVGLIQQALPCLCYKHIICKVSIRKQCLVFPTFTPFINFLLMKLIAKRNKNGVRVQPCLTLLMTLKKSAVDLDTATGVLVETLENTEVTTRVAITSGKIP